MKTSIYSSDILKQLNFLCAVVPTDALEKGLRYFIKAYAHRSAVELLVDDDTHPWGDFYDHVPRLRQGKLENIASNTQEYLRRAAVDATMLEALFDAGVLSESDNDFLKSIADPKQGADYLFELHTAYHLLRSGWSLRWLRQKGKHGEFHATLDGISVAVECKRFNYETGKRFAKKDVAKLASALRAEQLSEQWTGSVGLNLRGSWRASEPDWAALATEIRKCLNEGLHSLELTTVEASLAVDLQVQTGVVVPSRIIPELVISRAPVGATSLVFAVPAGRGLCRSPLSVWVSAEATGQMLTKLQAKFLRASKHQLGHEPAGGLFVSMEGLTGEEMPEFHRLLVATEFASSIFARRPKLALACFAAGPQIDKGSFSSRYGHRAIVFVSPNFPELNSIVGRVIDLTSAAI